MHYNFHFYWHELVHSQINTSKWRWLRKRKNRRLMKTNNAAGHNWLSLGIVVLTGRWCNGIVRVGLGVAYSILTRLFLMFKHTFDFEPTKVISITVCSLANDIWHSNVL